jgi:hypothetical protein
MGGIIPNPPPNPANEYGPNSWVSGVMPLNPQDEQYNQNLGIIDQATQNAYNGQYETHTYTDQNGVQHVTYSADGKNYNVSLNQNGDRVVQVTTPGQGNWLGGGLLGDLPSTTTYTLDPNGNMQVQQDNPQLFGGQNQTTTDFQRFSDNPSDWNQDPYGQDPYDQVFETQFGNGNQPQQPPGFINYPLPGQNLGGHNLFTQMMSNMPGGGTDDG